MAVNASALSRANLVVQVSRQQINVEVSASRIAE
jgi:hypothetical protein